MHYTQQTIKVLEAVAEVGALGRSASGPRDRARGARPDCRPLTDLLAVYQRAGPLLPRIRAGSGFCEWKGFAVVAVRPRLLKTRRTLECPTAHSAVDRGGALRLMAGINR